jgi:hypothetical protein
MLEKTKGTIKKQSRDTGSIGCTRHKTKEKGQSRNNPETQAALGTQNTRQNKRDNQETIQRHGQHWVHKTQDKTKGTIKKQSRDTGSIGYTRHKTKQKGGNLGTQGFQSFL